MKFGVLTVFALATKGPGYDTALNAQRPFPLARGSMELPQHLIYVNTPRDCGVFPIVAGVRGHYDGN